MLLRIIGGSLKGRSLKSPKGAATRPSTALLRKALFDIIRPQIEGAHFLDLFSGSGAIGIEAISRGAAHATFVEESKEAVHSIRNNLHQLQIENQATVVSYDFRLALKRLLKESKKFDIIFADPPYHQTDIYTHLLSFFADGHLLHPNSLLFLEEEAPSRIDTLSFPHLSLQKSRHFGRSLLHHYLYRL